MIIDTSMDDLQDSLHCSVVFIFFLQNTCVLTFIDYDVLALC